MKYRRGFCIECDSKITWNERSNLCESCFDKQLKISTETEIFNRDRKVESPHASWF